MSRVKDLHDDGDSNEVKVVYPLEIVDESGNSLRNAVPAYRMSEITPLGANPMYASNASAPPMYNVLGDDDESDNKGEEKFIHPEIKNDIGSLRGAINASQESQILQQNILAHNQRVHQIHGQVDKDIEPAPIQDMPAPIGLLDSMTTEQTNYEAPSMGTVEYSNKDYEFETSNYEIGEYQFETEK